MIEQGTEEWKLERMGYCTASRFKHVRSGFGFSESAKSYMLELVAERLTKVPMEGVDTVDTRRGIEQEPHAKMAYTARTGRMIDDVGFIKHKDPKILAGASLDGTVSKEGSVEVKCVTKKVQLRTILASRNQKNYCPAEHLDQIYGGLWITGRFWCDFISYCPELPDNLKLYIARVEKDEPQIEPLARDIKYFLKEVDKEYKKFKRFKQEL